MASLATLRARLSEAIRAGDQKSERVIRDGLVLASLAFATGLSARYSAGSPDCVGEAVLTLVEASRAYRPNRGGFQGYATRAILNRFRAERRPWEPFHTLPPREWIHIPADDSEPDGAEAATLSAGFRSLSPLGMAIVRGLAEGMNLAQIARAKRIPYHRIRYAFQSLQAKADNPVELKRWQRS